MNKFAYAFAAAVVGVAAPALAMPTIDNARCDSAFDAAGCTFITVNPYTDEQLSTAYNDFPKPGAPIELHRLTKFEYNIGGGTWEDAAGFTLPGGASVTGGGDWKSGTWSLPGFLVDFIAVKSAGELTLFGYTAPFSSSGTWTTEFMLNNGGKVPELSHLVFYGKMDDSVDPGGIPEPSSWAMLIAGFGLVGAVARRRKNASLTVTA